VSHKPEQFKNKIRKLYPEKAEEIIEVLSKPYPRFFRFNHCKEINENEVLKSLTDENIEFEKVEGIEAYKTFSENLSRSKAFVNNEIYIQELSSTLPVLEMNPQEGEKILDLCAAPGSKTTQIASITKNKAEITAVEENRKRFFKLKDNLEQSNANVKDILNLDGTKLLERNPEFENYFDKVLVDAPCSSEGQINFSDPESLMYWNKNKFKKFPRLQKALLESGFKALKKGGTLIYSTCTLAPEENEMVVNWLLENYSDAKLVELTFTQNCVTLSGVEGFVVYKKKTFDASLSKTIRITPDGEFTGFYLAKIRKV
jgi:NOL1/NOP2/sun family putative RNA methylase